MAVPIWPAELPQRPTRQGYSRGIADGRLFQQMGRGPAKSRRQYSSAVKPVAAGMILTTDQLMRFEQFWDVDTRGGSLPFLIPDAVQHEQPLSTADGDILTTEDGTPVLISAWWLVMFGQDTPASTPEGGNNYRLSFQLNVMP